MSFLPKKTSIHSPFGMWDDGLHHLMEGFFYPLRGEEGTPRLMPRIDLKEKDTSFVVKVDLPGMKKEDIELSLQDGVLTIEATRQDEHKEENDGELLRRERSYGRYVRQVSLGNNIDEASVHASFEDGVLEVVVPKLEAVPASKVKVDIK